MRYGHGRTLRYRADGLMPRKYRVRADSTPQMQYAVRLYRVAALKPVNPVSWYLEPSTRLETTYGERQGCEAAKRVDFIRIN